MEVISLSDTTVRYYRTGSFIYYYIEYPFPPMKNYTRFIKSDNISSKYNIDSFKNKITATYNNLYNLNNSSNIPLQEKAQNIPTLYLYKLYKDYYVVSKNYWLTIPTQIYINEPRWQNNCQLIRATNVNFHKLPIEVIDYICDFLYSKIQNIFNEITRLINHIKEIWKVFDRIPIDNSSILRSQIGIAIYPILIIIYTKIFRLYDQINDPYYKSMALRLISSSSVLNMLENNLQI